MHQRARPRNARVGGWVLALCLSACGSGQSDPEPDAVAFAPGPLAQAFEATVPVGDVSDVETIGFRIASKPGHRAKPIHVTFTRSHLERTGALDAAAGVVRVPIFGLYASFANQVTIEIQHTEQSLRTTEHVIEVPPITDRTLPALRVDELDPALPLGFFLVQAQGPPAVLDVDGEVRWLAPDVGEALFPCTPTPEGLVVGSLFSNAVYRLDWLGTHQRSVLGDPRCLISHHNLEPGRSGLLNTVTFQDAEIYRPQSVLVEMSPEGDIGRYWDFDEILGTRITSLGEDPAALVRPGLDWFHMNAAIYCAADDSLIVSSRENFVVKVDYATGDLRWILGNPEKLWYQAFPKSLQPLALDVRGTPPIGQHALSISPEGNRLLLFNNGMGHLELEDIGDSRESSVVSIYEIDEDARTADEIWSFDAGIHSPFCSSAYWTAAGNVIVVYSSPDDNSPARLLVVDNAGQVRMSAQFMEGRCGVAYSARELPLNDLVLR